MSNDLISRQEALDEWNRLSERGRTEFDQVLMMLPSAQPERLTDDDFETIRIHLSAYKEQLCNQHRWKEAEEYQRIIDRFMSFANAQPEIIYCKDCRFWQNQEEGVVEVPICARPENRHEKYPFRFIVGADGYCSFVERRTDE